MNMYIESVPNADDSIASKNVYSSLSVDVNDNNILKDDEEIQVRHFPVSLMERKDSVVSTSTSDCHYF